MRRFPSSASAFARSVVAGWLVTCGVASAATVVLRDGTVIQGEVRSLEDGVYTIETASVGAVHVRAEEVRSIAEAGTSPGTPAVGQPTKEGSPGADALDAAKSQISADPQLLAAVLALQNDPEVLAVLADPEVAKAMAAGDYNALMGNAKIVALMQNQKVREIVDALR
jgi:hypothetical protein